MNPDVLINLFIRNLTNNLPAMIVMVVGIVWTYSNWHRHPPAARWAMLAFVWMLFTNLLAITWYSFGILLLLHLEMGFDRQWPFLVTLSCFEGLAYIFFMRAIGAAWMPYRPPSFYDQFNEDEDRPQPS
jgi:hypothetical protein